MNNIKSRGVVITLIGLLGTFVTIMALDNSTLKTISIFVFIVLMLLLIFFILKSILGSIGLFTTVKTLIKAGIIRIYFSGNENVVGQHLANSRSIKIIAVSANALLKINQSELTQALMEKSAKVKVLLAQPDSIFVKEIEDMESNFRQQQIKNEIQNSIKLLNEYYLGSQRKNGSDENSGSIEIRHYNTQLRVSMIICDNQWGWITINLPPKRALQSISIEMILKPDGLLEDCISHFDQLWKLSSKIENGN